MYFAPGTVQAYRSTPWRTRHLRVALRYLAAWIAFTTVVASAAMLLGAWQGGLL